MECNRPTLHFFDLPAEIRNLIYSYAQLTGKDIKPILKIEKQHVGLNVACFSFPAKVFTVSKTFDREAAAVFYSKNSFSFDSVNSCYKFTQQIGSVKCASLQSIKMMNFDFYFTELDLMKKGPAVTFPEYLSMRCPALKRIEFSGVTPSGKDGEWRLPKLRQVEKVVDAMPYLVNGSYIKGPDALRLSVKDDNDPLIMEISQFNPWKMATGIVVGTPFDVKQELENLKARAAARRLAGTQKAIATKEAMKALEREEAEIMNRKKSSRPGASS